MESTEQWRPVVGYEGAYEVSSLGRVRSLDREVSAASQSRKWKMKGRVRSPYADGPYFLVCLKVDGTSTTRRIHVLVAEAFIGPRPEGMDVCHNNGDPRDNRVENLRYDTHAANQSDQTAHGTHWRGRRTHCGHGHEFTTENTLLRTDRKGGRRCIACERERSRKRLLAKSAA